MTSAHGGFGSETVPLGGGAAIFERLAQAWAEIPDLQLLCAGAGPGPPSGHPYFHLDCASEQPSRMGFLQYSHFCHRFEKETTKLALELKPDLVLAHDISEGPEVERLAANDIKVVTVFHVDVVDIFSRLYLPKALNPPLLTHFYRCTRLYPWPKLLQLVFDKQQKVMDHGVLQVVPSRTSAELLSDSYPDSSSEILRLGWGAPEPRFPEQEIEQRAQQLRKDFGLSPDAIVLLTLSRLSPEKAQDRLLKALLRAQSLGRLPSNLVVVIAGAPAFMQGEFHARKLKKLSEKLQITTLFPGHVGGLDKAAWYRTADLFVVNSLHESYGLTTLEALQQGCPVVAMLSSGTLDTVTEDVGRLVPPGPQLSERLWGEIEGLLREPDRRELSRLGEAALRKAREETFAKASSLLAEKILSLNP